MAWQDYLTDDEREGLKRLERDREDARQAFADRRKLLKSRAESRARQAQKKEP